jgi:hypothetical protein
MGEIMAKPHHVEPFWLVLKDEDRNIFTVVGPMTDDTPWIDRVSKAQGEKRQITCYEEKRALSREQVIVEARHFLGQRYRHVDQAFV